METNNYNTNIFKPKTKYAKINSKIIMTSILIWAIAVFGFQTALKILEKPVPEKSYITFSQAWNNIQQGTESENDKIELSKSVLTLMGKYPANRKNLVLKKAFTSQVSSFSTNTQETISLNEALTLLGLSEDSLLAKVVPYAIIPTNQAILTEAEKQQIPKLMEKYLIHNRSVLTDTKFLGFPFHYFYTSVFLLILFVVMCWIYCFVIQRINADLGINEDEA
jgi:hypothetical protein